MIMRSEVETTLGQRIHSELKRRGLSMRAFAKAIETTQPTVFKWCHDMNEPSLKSLKKMSEIFGVSPDWLMFGDGEKTRGSENDEAPAAMIISENGIDLINSATCLYYSVTNDEMSPTIEIGSTVMVDRSLTSIVQPGIYLIDLSGEMMLRRFRRALDGTIRVSCDNSSKYSEVETLRNDRGLKIVGKVVSKITIEKVS